MKHRLLVVLLIISVLINCAAIVALMNGKQEKSNYIYDYYGISSEDVYDAYATDQTVKAVQNLMISIKPNLSSNAAGALAHSIVLASKKYNVNPKYAALVSFVESGFDITATSPKGAKGMFQVMPFNTSNKQIIDFGINSIHGVEILKQCLKATNNNCLYAYICYIYGERGYKLNLNSADWPPTINKLAVLMSANNITNCGEFAYCL
jgi:hypothetical protein